MGELSDERLLEAATSFQIIPIPKGYGFHQLLINFVQSPAIFRIGMDWKNMNLGKSNYSTLW
jgi:hypothetical protein